MGIREFLSFLILSSYLYPLDKPVLSHILKNQLRNISPVIRDFSYWLCVSSPLRFNHSQHISRSIWSFLLLNAHTDFVGNDSRIPRQMAILWIFVALGYILLYAFAAMQTQESPTFVLNRITTWCLMWTSNITSIGGDESQHCVPWRATRKHAAKYMHSSTLRHFHHKIYELRPFITFALRYPYKSFQYCMHTLLHFANAPSEAPWKEIGTVR